MSETKPKTELKTDEPELAAETPNAPDVLPEKPQEKKKWYILKVQVNREDPIKRNLERRIAVAGLGEYFGEILVPTERVAEMRGDKKRIVKRKLYPGYIMIFMEINDDTWYLVRETSGVGDFTGASGKPTPMQEHEVRRMLAQEVEDPKTAPQLKVGYEIGGKIKIKDGTFESYEGIVDAIDLTSGKVTVILNLFSRSTPVELEYWQIEQNND